MQKMQLGTGESVSQIFFILSLEHRFYGHWIKIYFR